LIFSVKKLIKNEKGVTSNGLKQFQGKLSKLKFEENYCGCITVAGIQSIELKDREETNLVLIISVHS
jgi:hypothetical protein